MSLPSALPNQIPPQNVPFCYKDANDQMIVDINWYLFLYNQWKQFSSANGVALQPGLGIGLNEIDVNVTPSLQDVQNVLVLAMDVLLPDPVKIAASPQVSVLTSGATVNVDASNGDYYRLVLGINATLANPTNLAYVRVLNFRIIQDVTGSRTLAYGTMYKFPGGTAPVLSTAASAVDFMSCDYDPTDNTLICVLSKAFA